MYNLPEIMEERGRCYFTPILWEAQHELEQECHHEWNMLRERFAAAREGRFDALNDLLDIYLGLKDLAARIFAGNLLGDAGTDRQLEAVEVYIKENIWEPTNTCELCGSLGLWGRLSAVDPIMVAYDRNFPGQCGERLPFYLTTMLEAEYGPAANRPRENTIEAFIAYENDVRELCQKRQAELGGPKAYALFGDSFSVRGLAERYLKFLGRSSYEIVIQPYLRQHFEASTGIDCSDFYVEGELQPLTVAARLEAWLESSASDKFEPGERYFFGHRIPRK